LGVDLRAAQRKSDHEKNARNNGGFERTDSASSQQTTPKIRDHANQSDQ
jgi:hypothetical protein